MNRAKLVAKIVAATVVTFVVVFGGNILIGHYIGGWPSVLAMVAWASPVWAFHFTYTRRLLHEHWRTPRGGGHPRSIASTGAAVAAGFSAGLAAGVPGTRNAARAAIARAERAARRASVPTRVADEPIRAWKVAHLRLTGEGWRFSGIGVAMEYGVEEVAKCARQGDHPTTHVIVNGAGQVVSRIEEPIHTAPSLDCACGFYAVAEADLSTRYGFVTAAEVLLEVELYGRVIVHERGYRAEKQRVLSARMGTEWMPACQHVEPGDGQYPKTCGQEATYIGHEVPWTGRPTVLACEEHALLIDPQRLESFDMRADLRRDLPTDWTFV